MKNDKNDKKDHSDCGCKKEEGWIPINSRIQVNKDRTITIQAPSGWEYIGKVKLNSKVLRVSSGATSVSCTCNTSGSCLPFVGTGSDGSTSGCAGYCTNCTMKQSAQIENVTHDFLSGGYIDFADTVRFIENDFELPAAFPEMFELPEVEKAVKEFLERVYSGLPFPKMKIGENFVAAPTGYTMVPVSLFGRAVVVAVPTIAVPDKVNAGQRLSAAGGASKASCNCTDGICTVKTKSIPFVGSLTYCEGSCDGTCTLTTGTIIGGGDEVELYKAISYKF